MVCKQINMNSIVKVQENLVCFDSCWFYKVLQTLGQSHNLDLLFGTSVVIHTFIDIESCTACSHMGSGNWFFVSFPSYTISWSTVAWFYLMIVWFFTVFLTEWTHFLGNVKFVSWLADVGWPVVSVITDTAAASVCSVLSQV